MNKVLIVDDEQDVLNVLGKRLIESGFQVLKASSGAEGIEKARAERPNLIILDIWMPGMDGGEVAQKLQEYEETKSIPVIFLTCLYSKDEEKKEGHISGHNFILSKPYQPDELLKVVKEHLR